MAVVSSASQRCSATAAVALCWNTSLSVGSIITRSIRRDSPSRRQQKESANSRVVASRDRKRLGADFWGGGGISIRGVRLQGSRKFADDTVHAAPPAEAPSLHK